MSTNEQKAKDLFRQPSLDEALPEPNAPLPHPRRRMGMMRPGQFGGMPDEPQGMFNRAELEGLRNLALIELANIVGGYPGAIGFKLAKGQELDRGELQHFLDEASRISEHLGPKEHAVLQKISELPRQ